MKNNNISEAFAASLSFDSKEIIKDHSLTGNDALISKHAGINIYQPTIDNIEEFIQKYLMNELAFYPKLSKIGIQFVPKRFDSTHPDYVSEGSGTAIVRVEDALIELPFIVIDGELVPFDVIKLGNQRVPYSRENLKRIIGGIEKVKVNKDPAKEFTPYIKLDKAVNPSSSLGFLGDVLKIQEQYANRGMSGNMYVTSGEEFINAAIEKLANLKPLTKNDLDLLETSIRDVVVEMEVSKLQKEASQMNLDDTNAEMGNVYNLFQKVKDIPFVNASSLPNGSVVTFPQIHELPKQGKEIESSKGIIIDNYMDFAGYVPSKKTKVILSQDGMRYCSMKILDNKDPFMCISSPKESFHLPLQTLDTVEERDIIMAFDGNKALYPCVVNRISERTMDPNGEVGYGIPSCIGESKPFSSTATGRTTIKTYHLTPIHHDPKVYNLFADDGMDHGNEKIFDDRINITLTTLSGAKFLEMPYNEFIKNKAEELGLDELHIMKLAPKCDLTIGVPAKNGRGYMGTKDTNVVFCTDENTKVIVIKSLISGYLKRPEDLENFANNSNFEFAVNEKTASDSNEYVEIRSIGQEEPMFEAKVSHIDKTKKVFKTVNRSFKLKEVPLREMLRVLGFSVTKIAEIVSRAKSENYAKYELPMGSDPSRLVGGQIGSMVQDKMNVAKSKILDSGVSDALAAEVLGSLLAAAVLGGGATGEKVYNTAKKFASESAALSVEFEKLAQERKSDSMLKVATLMSVASMFNEKVAEVAGGKVQYAKLNDVINDIVLAKPYMEKVAEELINLKVAQYVNRNHIVNPNYIQSAVQQIDYMYKTAECLYNHLDKIAISLGGVGKAVGAFGRRLVGKETEAEATKRALDFVNKSAKVPKPIAPKINTPTPTPGAVKPTPTPTPGAVKPTTAPTETVQPKKKMGLFGKAVLGTGLAGAGYAVGKGQNALDGMQD